MSGLLRKPRRIVSYLFASVFSFHSGVATTLGFSRHAALLDTNVLVALHGDNDSNHEQALLVIEEENSYLWLVTIPVIVESCGLLGVRRTHKEVYDLPPLASRSGIKRCHHSGVECSCVIGTGDTRASTLDAPVSCRLGRRIANESRGSSHSKVRIEAPPAGVHFDTGDYLRCSGRKYLRLRSRNIAYSPRPAKAVA
jgi:hypothetical protein